MKYFSFNPKAYYFWKQRKQKRLLKQNILYQILTTLYLILKQNNYENLFTYNLENSFSTII